MTTSSRPAEQNRTAGRDVYADRPSVASADASAVATAKPMAVTRGRPKKSTGPGMRDVLGDAAGAGGRADADTSTVEAAPSRRKKSAGLGEGAILSDRASGDEGADAFANTCSSPPPHPSSDALIGLQRKRRFCIKSQSRIDRSCEAFIAQALGLSYGMSEESKKALYKRAKRIRLAIEKGAVGRPDTVTRAPPSKRSATASGTSQTIATDEAAVAAACSVIVIQSAVARKAWDTLRLAVEADMRKLAQTLPVWDWAKTVKGFGALGAALIAAEAAGPRGDVGSYATKERLWKRLGLAVINGERQRRVEGQAAIEHGFNPSRRAEIWTIADSMIRHQWNAATETEAAGPAGPYGAVYMHRKSHTALREWHGFRKEADARRIMTKALIEDYWRVWRGKRPIYATQEPADWRMIRYVERASIAGSAALPGQIAAE